MSFLRGRYILVTLPSSLPRVIPSAAISLCLSNYMGQSLSSSRLTTSGSQRLESSPLDESRHAGLENFGNTCYANSVLQALYACTPFRERVLRHAEEQAEGAEETLLSCLGDLFREARAPPRPPRRSRLRR